MLTIKPLATNAMTKTMSRKTTCTVRLSAIPVLLLASFCSFAATDEEAAEIRARIAALEAAPSWNSTQSQTAEALSIHGYVNAGVSSSNTDGVTDISGGIGDEMNYQAHQSFGLQLGYQLDGKTEVVAQIQGLAYEDNMNVRMNWAYIGRSLLQDKGAMTDLKLRVGRAPSDTFMISEYYDVGYAYPWVIPPREAYGQIGGGFYDGMDLTAYFSLPNDWNMQLKGFMGSVNIEPIAGQADRFEGDKSRGVNVIFERDAWRLRAGYAQATLKFEVCCGDVAGFDLLSGGYNEFEAGYEDLVAGIQTIDPTFDPDYAATPITDTAAKIGASFGGVGFTYDNGDWLVMGEYLLSKLDNYNPERELAYMTVGKRFGDWMPYLTASQSKAPDNDKAAELAEQVATMKANLEDPQVAAAIAGAEAAANGGIVSAQSAISAGEGILGSFAAGDSATALGICSAVAMAVITDEAQCLALGGAVLTQGQEGVAAAEAGLSELAALEEGVNGIIGGADSLSAGFLGMNAPQKTYSVGVRYDFSPGVTAKVQVDKITGFEDTRGSLDNAYVSHFAIQAAF